MAMNFEWDPAKRASNILKHGLYFEDAAAVFNSLCFTNEDLRQHYGEKRFICTGKLGGRLVVIVYAIRGTSYRIISMRKANERERQDYKKRFGAT